MHTAGNLGGVSVEADRAAAVHSSRHVADDTFANALYDAADGVSMLYIAAEQGHAAVVAHLLRHGARPAQLRRAQQPRAVEPLSCHFAYFVGDSLHKMY